MSADGLAVQSSLVHPPGTRLFIEYQLPSGESKSLTARVVWSVRPYVTLGQAGVMGLEVVTASDDFKRLSDVAAKPPEASTWTRPPAASASGPESGLDRSGPKARPRRYPVDHPVTVHTYGAPEFSARLMNVSIVGLALATPALLAPGTAVTVSFDALGKRILVEASVTSPRRLNIHKRTPNTLGLKVTYPTDAWREFVEFAARNESKAR